MATKQKSVDQPFYVNVKITLDLSVPLKGVKTLEEALATAKNLEVPDIIKGEFDYSDYDKTITGVWTY